MKRQIIPGISCAALLASVAPLHAATVFQTVDNIDWNDAMWGAGPDAPTAGNEYVNDPAVGLFRISAGGASSTFGGDSLTHVGDGTEGGNRGLVKLGPTGTATINGAYNLNGGWLHFAPNSGDNITFAVNSFNVGADSVISGANSLAGDGETVTITGAFSGSGALAFSQPDSSDDVHFIIDDLGSFSGAFDLQDGTRLGLNNTDFTFGSTFDIAGTSSLIVGDGQTLTFAQDALSDSVNGTVPEGTYSGTDLDNLGAHYVNEGGTLEVVPEPSITLLGGLGALGLLRRRRDS